MCVLWGTTYLGIRIALETIPPALVGGLRYTAAGTLLIGILSARGEGMISPSQWRGQASSTLTRIEGGVRATLCSALVAQRMRAAVF